MASWRVVYACPDCDGTDLEEDEHGLWCPDCETLFAFTQFSDPPDYQHPEDDTP